MEKISILTGNDPVVTIEAHGDLVLKGQDELAEVIVKCDNPDDVSLTQEGDTITLRCESECRVRVPMAAKVNLTVGHGDVICKALDGVLKVGEVHGDLELRGVGPVHLSKAHGDLNARNVGGDLLIDTVDGNASLRDVQGSLEISGAVKGNLSVQDVDGDAQALAMGNVSVRIDPAPGQAYSFEARGNLFCRVPGDASVEVNIPKAGGRIQVNLPGVALEAAPKPPYSLKLGDGDASLELKADGNVALDTHAPDWSMLEDVELVDDEVEGMADTLTQQIEQQVEAQMRMIEEQMKAQMASLNLRLGSIGLSEEQARRVEERARQASEQATLRAQERMRRAQERIDQKMLVLQRRMENKGRTGAGRRGRIDFSFGSVPRPPVPPVPPPPPGEKVSEEERLMILRMLEQKKISMDEAEKLLSALEGKAG